MARRHLITIPNPCPEPWDGMTPVAGGRHCAKCDTNLVDLSAMSERDANVIVALSKKICARLTTQGGRNLFAGPASLVAATAIAAGCGGSPEPMHPVGIVMPRDIGPSDRDNDRIVDGRDRCPDEPEDEDQYQDEDGCPDVDNDSDQVEDLDDLCALEPEDADRWEDGDGCPDPDNDNDRLLDAADKCPQEPETWNGIDDEDGCPDRAGVVVVDNPQIVAKVTFAAGSAKLTPKMNEVVDAIASTLAANPGVGVLHIYGHAKKNERDRAKLATLRAQAVAEALKKKGVTQIVVEPPALDDDTAEVTFDLVH